jgi:hypothetical protein
MKDDGREETGDRRGDRRKETKETKETRETVDRLLTSSS